MSGERERINAGTNSIKTPSWWASRGGEGGGGGGEHEQDDDDDGDGDGGDGAEGDKDVDGSDGGNIIIDDGDDELRLMRQQIQLKHLGLQKKDGKFSQMFLVGVSNEH